MRQGFRGGAATIAAITAMLAASPAKAQRTDDNVVDEAEDAFGKTVGGQSIGIYNTEDVRGFSPVAAGNVRIEGLYFDQQAHVTDRVIDGRTVHVGLSAQGYAFPAPTGIADYDLRKPGKDLVISPAFTYGAFKALSGEVDVQVPLDGERLGLIAGVGYYDERQGGGQSALTHVWGASLRYAPSPDFSIQPFVSGLGIKDEEAHTLIFSAGDYLPKRIKRGPFYGQKWADFSGSIRTYGVVSKGKLAGFDLALGVFRSEFRIKEDHADLLFDVDRDGNAANRTVVRDGGNRFGSTSGEFRVSRTFRDGPRQHLLHATARGRSLARRYGGEVRFDLGPSVAGAEDFELERAGTIGPKSRDAVEQKTFGLGYELRWAKRGELSLGLQKTDYAKRVTDPAGDVERFDDAPWLPSVTGALHLGKSVALYGGFVRGLEESDVAPSEADNRNEAPPAIRTKQMDFGARWAITPKVSAVLGWFSVEKPHFDLDAGGRFRKLGEIRNSGLEFSLSGKFTPRLTLVTGALLLDAKVSGEDVRPGGIGKRPVGWIKLRTITNVNWNLPWHEPLTLTARFESTSDRTANSKNSFVVPARQVLNLGARYKFKLAGKPVLAIADVGNVFNKFGWAVVGPRIFVANNQRRFSLTLAADL